MTHYERQIHKSSRSVIRLVSNFILETNDQTNYKWLPNFFQTDHASLLWIQTLTCFKIYLNPFFCCHSQGIDHLLWFITLDNSTTRDNHVCASLKNKSDTKKADLKWVHKLAQKSEEEKNIFFSNVTGGRFTAFEKLGPGCWIIYTTQDIWRLRRIFLPDRCPFQYWLIC